MRECKAMTTLFVATQSASDGCLPWSQRLGYRYPCAAVASARHPLLGDEAVSIDADTPRRSAYLEARRRLVDERRRQRDDHLPALAGRWL